MTLQDVLHYERKKAKKKRIKKDMKDLEARVTSKDYFTAPEIYTTSTTANAAMGS